MNKAGVRGKMSNPSPSNFVLLFIAGKERTKHGCALRSSSTKLKILKRFYINIDSKAKWSLQTEICAHRVHFQTKRRLRLGFPLKLAAWSSRANGSKTNGEWQFCFGHKSDKPCLILPNLLVHTESHSRKQDLPLLAATADNIVTDSLRTAEDAKTAKYRPIYFGRREK